MESADKEFIATLLKRDVKLQRLYKQHVNFEEQLSHYQKRPFLTNEEEREEKKLKQQKLQGVDQIMVILAAHRDGEART